MNNAILFNTEVDRAGRGLAVLQGRLKGAICYAILPQKRCMRFGQSGQFSLFSVLLLSVACSAPFSHTSDESLERFFKQHQLQFEALLAEVQADTQLTTVQRETLVYAGATARAEGRDLSKIKRLGMSRDRWVHYQKELRDLNLYGVMKGTTGVEFRVDPGTFLNGDSYKGFEYRGTKPVTLRQDLDRYAPSARDREGARLWAVYKPIAKDWYLYFFVNH